MLIIECDTAKLEAQGIVFAHELAGVTRILAPGAASVLVQATTQAALLEQLAAAKAKHATFDVVVLVGHSNIAGLRLFHGPLVTWPAVANWLKTFEPRQVVLVACEAGRWLPSRTLFSGIPTLDEIYGSPVVTTAAQAAAVKFLVPFLAMGGALDGDAAQHLLQLGNFLLTGGVIFRQTREEFARTDVVEGLLWTGLEEVLRTVLPRIRASIGSRG